MQCGVSQFSGSTVYGTWSQPSPVAFTVTFDEFQSVAAAREKALRDLTGTKQARTTVETQADPSKFMIKDKQFGDAKVVQKQPKQEPPKKPEQKKKPVTPKPQPQTVAVTDLFNVRSRGGPGGPRGGRGGPAASRAPGATDRQPTPTSTPPGEAAAPNWQGKDNAERPPRGATNSPRGGRQGGGGGGYGSRRVPNANQFPDLPVKPQAAPTDEAAQTAPK